MNTVGDRPNTWKPYGCNRRLSTFLNGTEIVGSFFRVVADFLIYIFDAIVNIPYTQIFKFWTVCISTVVFFWGSITSIQFLNYKIQQYKLTKEQLNYDLDRKFAKWKEELDPTLMRADQAYEDLQYYKAHQVHSVIYKLPKPKRATIMNGANKGKTIIVNN